MKLLFMFCNSCMHMVSQSKNWLVDHQNCTCIFLEESLMTLTRRTYWSNGLITDRDLEFEFDKTDVMIKEQRKRVDLGPGIDRVELISKVNGGKVTLWKD